jgi:cytochrome oxidase Cu insertion factor (SCO1/SenC/PrrC family)
VKHKSFVPWLVALVCFGPFAVALLIYYAAPSLLPQLPGSRELLEPPVPLPEQWRSAGEAAGAWQLIYARMTPCEQQCAQHLGRLLQVQLALGRDQNRVQRVVWHVGSLPELGDRDLTKLSLNDAAGRGIVAELDAERMVDGRLYVADPRGEVILSYPPDVEQKELLRDLKRLLAGSDS